MSIRDMVSELLKVDCLDGCERHMLYDVEILLLDGIQVSKSRQMRVNDLYRKYCDRK